MDHLDHIRLLQHGIPTTGGRWADLGSGDGAFTLALRDILGPTVQIWSIDHDQQRLQIQQRQFDLQFPGSKVKFLCQDFTAPLDLPPLDGLIMANSLHYLPRIQQTMAIITLAGHLKPGGMLLLVEYESDQPNNWVPHPVPFQTWQRICHNHAALAPAEFLTSVPSTFMHSIYSSRSSRRPWLTPDDLADVRRVGPDKPLGYISGSQLLESPLTWNELELEFNQRGLKTRRFTGQDTNVVGGVLYAYDPIQLQHLLDRNSSILAQAHWPNDPETFVDQVEHIHAPAGTPLWDVVARAFGHSV